MTSLRLKAVYNTARWRGPIREFVLTRAGYRCEAVTRHQVFGEDIRCNTYDVQAGGPRPLLIDHKDENHPDPFDTDNLQALCARHSGMKDGGRAHDKRKGIVR